VNHKVGVLDARGSPRRLDQQPLDRLRVGLEIFHILQETRSVAIQHEGMGERGEGRIQFRRFRWFVPKAQPDVAIVRRKSRAEQPDKKFQRGNAKIRARPVDGNDRVICVVLDDLGRANDAATGLAPDDRQPRVSQKIEHQKPRVDGACRMLS